MSLNFLVALLVAVFLDVCDVFGFTWLPVIGDILDVLGLLLLFVLLRSPYVAIGCLELIPLADLIPFHTFAVLMSRETIRKRMMAKIG